MVSAEIENPYISSMVLEISRWDIPLAYIASTLFSIADTSLERLGINLGSNVASLSLGTSISISPLVVINDLLP